MSGTKREPVLWAVERGDGLTVTVCVCENDARNEADRLNTERLRSDYVAVPLYRDPPPPTLTDVERETLERLDRLCDFLWREGNQLAGLDAGALRVLLARLGGDK